MGVDLVYTIICYFFTVAGSLLVSEHEVLMNETYRYHFTI